MMIGSGLLHQNLLLDEVLTKIAALPAQAMSMADATGTLKVGAWGDAVVLAADEGSIPLADSAEVIRTWRRMLSPSAVIRQG